MTFREFIQQMCLLDLPPARCLSKSKSAYLEKYPSHHVIFDALIEVKVNDAIYEWEGDLDLTEDFEKLMTFCNLYKFSILIYSQSPKELKYIMNSKK